MDLKEGPTATIERFGLSTERPETRDYETTGLTAGVTTASDRWCMKTSVFSPDLAKHVSTASHNFLEANKNRLVVPQGQ